MAYNLNDEIFISNSDTLEAKGLNSRICTVTAVNGNGTYNLTSKQKFNGQPKVLTNIAESDIKPLAK